MFKKKINERRGRSGRTLMNWIPSPRILDLLKVYPAFWSVQLKKREGEDINTEAYWEPKKW